MRLLSLPVHLPGVLPGPRPDRAIATGAQFALFDDSSSGVVSEPAPDGCADLSASEWSEEEIVLLHWRLLQELAQLPHAETPLDEKIDTLNWVFTEAHKDRLPFSFANCVRVVGCSPLSPTAYFGAVDVDAIRDWIRAHVARWMRSTVERYPDWVRRQIAADPQRVARELERDPQWLNEQVKRRAERHELFAVSA